MFPPELFLARSFARYPPRISKFTWVSARGSRRLPHCSLTASEPEQESIQQSIPGPGASGPDGMQVASDGLTVTFRRRRRRRREAGYGEPFDGSGGGAPAWPATGASWQSYARSGSAGTASPSREHTGRFGLWGTEAREQWSCCLCEVRPGSRDPKNGSGIEDGCERARFCPGPGGMTAADDVHLVPAPTDRPLSLADRGAGTELDAFAGGSSKGGWSLVGDASGEGHKRGAEREGPRAPPLACSLGGKRLGSGWSLGTSWGEAVGGRSSGGRGRAPLPSPSASRPRTAHACLVRRSAAGVSNVSARPGARPLQERARVVQGPLGEALAQRPNSAPTAWPIIASLRDYQRQKEGWRRVSSSLPWSGESRASMWRPRSAVAGRVSVYARAGARGMLPGGRAAVARRRCKGGR